MRKQLQKKITKLSSNTVNSESVGGYCKMLLHFWTLTSLFSIHDSLYFHTFAMQPSTPQLPVIFISFSHHACSIGVHGTMGNGHQQHKTAENMLQNPANRFTP